jgi:hypothetical protein
LLSDFASLASPIGLERSVPNASVPVFLDVPSTAVALPALFAQP